MDRAARLAEFVRRMRRMPPAASAEEALEMLSGVLDAVENEFTGIPYQPDGWKNDGRMYPPQADAARDVEGRPELTRYRSANHNTWIGANGALLIRSVGDDTPMLDKPGADGCKIELD